MANQCDPCQCGSIHYNDERAWRKAMLALLCQMTGGSAPSAEAEFSPAVSLGEGDIGLAYSAEAVLSDARKLMIDNQTDGDVWISLDGVTNHYYLRSGQNLNIDFFALGLTCSATVYVKDGSVAPGSGVCFIYVVS